MSYNCFMNEHIRSNTVANMCYTTLLTKKSHGSLFSFKILDCH